MNTFTCSIWLYEQEILQVMGITACGGMGEKWRWSKGEEEEGRGMRRGGRIRGNSAIDKGGEATVEEM